MNHCKIAVGLTADANLAQKIKANDVEEIGKIGYLYEMGDDFLKALELYKIATEKNSTHATLQLGELYSKGQGVPKDYLTGAECYLRALKLSYKVEWVEFVVV
jgi:TPR repeat protein